MEQLCSKCSALNPLGSKFCNECGHALESSKTGPPESNQASPTVTDSAAPREERRWATLLFADLSGFTSLSEQLDPEDVKTLAHRCTQQMSEEVRRFGGTVININGDLVIAAFGAPIAHEDDAERAVRAALAMRDCSLQDNTGRPIQIHAGINTGEVMAGVIGPQEHQDYTVMGDTTNVAARLMSAAPAGSVLVGEETWRATRGVIRYLELPPVLAKGKQQPVPVWKAQEALAGPKSRPLGSAPLVGRDEELELLCGIWRRVVNERRIHLITVLGDPGLGKSRLVAEFEKRFCAEARVLHGRCLPYGEALGYWALTTALREAVGISAESDAAAARAQLQQSAREVLLADGEADPTELTRHLALLSGLNTAEDRFGNPPDQRALHGSVRRFFEALARQQPLCWMVEDIHWADDTLLDLIEFVAAQAKEAPLLILTQARPSLLEKRPNWGAGVQKFTSLALRTLSPQAGHELVLALCRERGLAPTVADEVGRGAGGNPLFAEELVATIAERGQAAGVPSAIKALIAARLDALPSGERLLLQLSAVFGKAFWLGGLRALGAEQNVTVNLERLEKKDLLRSQSRSQFRNEREFSFKHDLIRDVAYETLPRAERKILHGKAADWIQRAAGEHLETYFDQLAHHTLNAGKEERAIDFLASSAQYAHRLGAHRREATILAQAVEIAERLGKHSLAAELRARRGTAFGRVGAFSEARIEMESALKEMPVDRVERRAEIFVDLSVASFYGLDLLRMRQCAAEALALAEQVGRRDLEAEALGWQGFAAQADGHLDAAMELHRRAISRAGHHPTLARSNAPLTLYLLGQSQEAIELGQESVRQVRDMNHASGIMWSLSHLGLAFAGTGQFGEALKTFEEARHYGREHEVWSFLARAIAMSAGFHLDIFDFSGNEALVEEARELARQVNFAPSKVSASIDLLLNLARRHDCGRAEKVVTEAVQAAEATGGWHLWLWRIRLAEAQAELALERGDWNEAIQKAEDAIQQSRAKHRAKYELLGLWTRARALDKLGRRHEAISVLETALAMARPLGDPAMILRLAEALLAIDGTDTLAAEAGAAVNRIVATLPDGAMRQGFEQAGPVRSVRKLTRSQNMT
jgi:class 3 adenylate cyclase/tetratricopeptide (TPR) repeat protein